MLSPRNALTALTCARNLSVSSRSLLWGLPTTNVLPAVVAAATKTTTTSPPVVSTTPTPTLPTMRHPILRGLFSTPASSGEYDVEAKTENYNKEEKSPGSLLRAATATLRRKSGGRGRGDGGGGGNGYDGGSSSSDGLAPFVARLQQLTVYGVAASGATAITYGMWRTTSYMSGITFWDVGHASFYLGGIVTAGMGVGAYLLARRYSSVQPDALFDDALRRVTRNPTLKRALGTGVKPGKFKAYADTGGLVVDGRRGSKWLGILPRPSWQASGLQMLFQINGDKGSGMCSVEAQKPRGHARYKITSLGVDLSNGDRVVLIGQPEDLAFKGIVHLR